MARSERLSSRTLSCPPSLLQAEMLEQYFELARKPEEEVRPEFRAVRSQSRCARVPALAPYHAT